MSFAIMTAILSRGRWVNQRSPRYWVYSYDGQNTSDATLKELGKVDKYLTTTKHKWYEPWWHCQMEKFCALLSLYAGNSLVTGEFPAQRPVMRSFDIFFDLCLNKQLSKQSWG